MCVQGARTSASQSAHSFLSFREKRGISDLQTRESSGSGGLLPLSPLRTVLTIFIIHGEGPLTRFMGTQHCNYCLGSEVVGGRLGAGKVRALVGTTFRAWNNTMNVPARVYRDQLITIRALAILPFP